jgi:hypothetical protein
MQRVSTAPNLRAPFVKKSQLAEVPKPLNRHGPQQGNTHAKNELGHRDTTTNAKTAVAADCFT